MFGLDQIVLREIELELVAPFTSARGSMHSRRSILVEAISTEGVSGWGECVALEHPGYSTETVDTAWADLSRVLGPAVLGVEWLAPQSLDGFLRSLAPNSPMARAAIEMASWDVAARLEKVPLAHLLGGRRRAVETGVVIGIPADHSDWESQLEEAVDAGYRRIKIKIAPGRDLDVVRLARRLVPEQIPLWVDANGSYDPDDPVLAALDEARLGLIEQPLPAGDLAGTVRLRSRMRTPICLDEAVSSHDDAVRMIESGAADALNLKPGRVGGFSEAIAIHDTCNAAGVQLWCGGMLESGIGRAHNVAIASLQGFELPGDLSPSRRYWRKDVISPEWTMERGLVAVPWERPGLGVEVAETMLESVTTRRRVLASTS